MPSIADSRKLVKESVGSDLDHDAILASLQDEIDRHNADRSRHSKRSRRHASEDSEEQRQEREASALRFRFKHDRRSLKEHKKRKRKHSRDTAHETAEPKEVEEHIEHPFPREPASPTAEPSDDAFLSSLLDALADDEAASYWESVYSQPIHTFQRPSVETEKGTVEQMNDEEYAAWVKRKMWEKEHPEIVAERDKMQQKRAEEEELKRKRKEEFIKKRQRNAWTHASKVRPEEDYVFDFSTTNSTSQRTEPSDTNWKHAWRAYLEAWEKLKSVDLSAHEGEVSSLLPWPVLPSKPPTKPNIEDFLHHMPRTDSETKRRLLKVERIRWHPDKVQQRFGGRVDEGTMKVVTGIFQIIDAMWADKA